MKVVCISKAHHMWNYTEGKTYTMSDNISDSFWQGGQLFENHNETTITDDRDMKMYWVKPEVKLYFITLREHNLKKLIIL